MAVNLSPLAGAGAQFFDNSGNVLTGGKLYTYLAGTTTPAVTYTSNNGVTPHSNPIILNAAGRVPDSGEIWLTDGVLYKFVLKDSNDVQIATWDNIDGINSNFVAYSTQNETATATQGQTVFTLTSIQYQPATNNLAVYVNGSKQILTLNYIETSSTVVTFVDGLNVGDVVQFTTASAVATNVVDASNVSYNEGDTGAVDQNVQDRLRVYVSVKDFGAVGDGVTDDAVAIQDAINSDKPIYFPAGIYLCSNQITKASGFFDIRGDGANITEIQFDSSTTDAGFAFTQQTDQDYAKVVGFTFSSSTGYVAGKTALYIDGSPQVSAGSPRGVTLNRSERRVLIDDVEVRGVSDSATTGWGVGIRTTSLGWCNISNYAFLGDYSQGATTGDWQGYAIQIDGDGMPVESKFSKLSIYSAYAGIFLPDYFEGLYVNQFDMVNVQYGILAEYTAGVSFYPSQTLCGLLQPTITDGHINCRKIAIKAVNVSQAFIADLNIYLNPQNADTNFIGIILDTGNGNNVHNNSISNQNQALVTNLAWGVILRDIGRSYVTENSIYYFKGSGIYLNDGASFSQSNYILSNLVYSSTNIVAIDANSVNNFIDLNTGLLITSLDYTLATNNYIPKRQFNTSVVYTLTGGAPTEVVTITVPSAYFKAKPTSGFLMATDSTEVIGWFNFTTGTTTQAQFTVANRGGGNLTPGLIRFSVAVYE
jgi:hypothetical protein